jgi:hypothetical protein
VPRYVSFSSFSFPLLASEMVKEVGKGEKGGRKSRGPEPNKEGATLGNTMEHPKTFHGFIWVIYQDHIRHPRIEG